eukprot:jgi/Ulvmu1/9625/UM054_0055.1
MVSPLTRRASLLEQPHQTNPTERRQAMANAGAEQVFDFDKWGHHRSIWKYWREVLTIPKSHTLKSCVVPSLWVLAISLLIGMNEVLGDQGLLPKWLQIKHSDTVQQPLTITSFALSLLLVFRTNSSYGRFAEARSIWGMVLNRSRDLARQAASFFPTATWDAKASFARWTICFSKCLLIHLRPHLSLREEIAMVLGREELQILLAAEHPVVMCIQVMSELVEAAPIPAMQRWQMHENLTKLHDLLGACERIMRTPIPVAYTRHTTRCLILWLTVMPYALWGNLGWATIVAAPLISFLLSGINEIGIDVEEPFSLLPLEAIADRAQDDCHEIISMQLLLADRLTEAREEGLNGHVFRVVLDEFQTRLADELDLVPFVRRNCRVGIADGIAVKGPGGAADAARTGLGVSSIRTSMHTVHASRTPVTMFSSPPQRPPSGAAASAGGDSTSASPRIRAEEFRGEECATQAAAEAGAAVDACQVGAVRRRYYGRDCGDHLARLVSMNSGLPA